MATTMRAGIFKIKGDKKDQGRPDHYFYAEMTGKPGEIDGYPSGWVATIGSYVTHPSFSKPPRDVQCADGGMTGAEWKRARRRRTSWSRVPAWWQTFFHAHLDRAQYNKAKATKGQE